MLPPTSTATSPARSAAASPDTGGPGRALGFTSQWDEITVDALPVEGEVPAWITGSLLRNGPAQWDLRDGAVNHWFDGMAMLHRFGFGDGSVSYRNKLLRGKAATAFERDGKLSYREFATDPCKSTFGRVASLFNPNITDNGAVNISKIGEQWLATTESPMAVVFDPITLEALGSFKRATGARVPTAHEHIDRTTGEIYGFRLAFGRVSAYELTATNQKTGAERLVAKLPAERPAYSHSFALTDRYIVFGEHPLVANPLKIAFSGKPFIESFEWQPERGVKFTAVDRVSGEIAGEWTAPASFCFHHVNAFDDGDGSIVMDLCLFEDASIVRDLSLSNLRAAEPKVPAPAILHRYRLRSDRTDVIAEDVPAAAMELPRIDERFNRRAHRYLWGTGLGEGGDAFFDRIVGVDLATGETRHWHEPNTYAGEPVFVARPGSDAEADGVVLSVLLEPDRGASSLLILDPITLTEIARARVPQHIPLGFHGGFVKSIV